MSIQEWTRGPIERDRVSRLAWDSSRGVVGCATCLCYPVTLMSMVMKSVNRVVVIHLKNMATPPAGPPAVCL